MYRNILIAVDDTSMASRLVQEAVSITANKEDCLISLLHVETAEDLPVTPVTAGFPQTGVGLPQTTIVPTAIPGAVLPVVSDDSTANTITEDQPLVLQETCQLLEEQGVNYQPVLKVGNAAKEICKFAEEEDVDLIIMGRREKGALEKLFMGSVSQKVVQDAATPVLIVK